MVFVDLVLLSVASALGAVVRGFGARGDGFDVDGGGLDAVTLVGAVLGDSKKEKSAFAHGSSERSVNLDRSPRLDLLGAFGTKAFVLNGSLEIEPLA